MTVYAAGLRVSELLHLKLSDIDAERMMIRVEQGKGKKDRYTILSQRLLGELRKYKQAYQPVVLWVFFGKTRNDPLHITAARQSRNRRKTKRVDLNQSPWAFLSLTARQARRRCVLLQSP
jgi:integrase